MKANWTFSPVREFVKLQEELEDLADIRARQRASRDLLCAVVDLIASRKMHDLFRVIRLRIERQVVPRQWREEIDDR